MFAAIAILALIQLVSVTPSTAPSVGGTRVSIRGSGFCGGGACSAEETAHAFFAGAFSADEHLVSDQELIVRVPPGRGTVDLLVTSPHGPAVLPHAFTYIDSRPSDYERVLVPISGTYPGAFNSTWMTELFVHNSGDGSVFLSQAVPESDHFGCLLCPVTDVPGYVLASAHASVLDFTNHPSPGLLVLVSPKPLREAVHFDLLVRNTALPRGEWGAEIPVVREDQFRTGATELMNIPLDSRYRSMLRIYDVDNIQDGSDTTVLVRRYLRHSLSETLIDETKLAIHETAGGGGQFPLYPGYEAWSGINSDLPSSGDTMRIEIEPLTPGLRYWAFVSVTNNDTQSVTVISPN